MIKNIINSRWMLIVGMAIVTVIGGVTIVQAWTAPSSGNVKPPITSSSVQQHKEGKLTLNNNLAVGRHMNTADMNIAGNLQLVGKSNCELKTDAAGNVVCASGGSASAMTGPFQCLISLSGSGTSGAMDKTCDIPGSADNQVCFLTQVKDADNDDIDAFRCHVYYTPAGWKLYLYAQDFNEAACSASCIQL